MKNFKGFDDWIEIFRGGTQTDSAGRIHDADAMIDTAVKFFAPGSHEPPLVVGHPADNAPAFGWVEGLKTDVKDGATVLLAKFKDVVPEFEALAKQGLYKKRSASFYPDGRLRHVGFLGAAAPAVKGLADIGFTSIDAVTFEFGEVSPWTWSSIARVFRNLREWLIEKEGKEAADALIPEWNIEDLTDEQRKALNTDIAESGFNESTSTKGEVNMKFSEFLEVFKFWKSVQEDPDATLPAGSHAKSFTEADIEAAKKEAAAEERQKADTEFAEKQRTAQRAARDKEVEAFCEALVEEKKIPPSWVKSGLVSFMQGLDGEQEISFADAKPKQTPLAWFKSFLEGFGESPIFREIATKEAAGKQADFTEAKKDQEVGESIAVKVN